MRRTNTLEMRPRERRAQTVCLSTKSVDTLVYVLLGGKRRAELLDWLGFNQRGENKGPKMSEAGGSDHPPALRNPNTIWNNAIWDV